MTNTIEIQAKSLHGWEACELSAAQLEIAVIPLGGRIISLKFCGKSFFSCKLSMRAKVLILAAFQKRK